MLVDGDIIATGNVIADNITVTSSSYTEAYTLLTTSYANIKSVSLTSTEQKAVIWFSGIAYHDGEDPATIYIQVKRSSTIIWAGNFRVGGNGNPNKVPIAISLTTSPPNGANTFYIYCKADGSGRQIMNKSIIVTEYKR
jgi:hypothetical protein